MTADTRFVHRLIFQPAQLLASGQVVAAEMLPDWPLQPHRGLEGQLAGGRGHGRAGQAALAAMQAACIAAQHWPAGMSLWLNLPAGFASDLGFPAKIAAMLALSGLPSARISLELPERLGNDIDSDRLIALSGLRDLGVGLVLDGFGSRSASLAALRRLPLTGMKLDRGLVRGLPEEREDAALVRAAIDTALALGLQVIADGIETERQRCFLAAIGCQIGQGMLFSHPLTDVGGFSRAPLPSCVVPIQGHITRRDRQFPATVHYS